MSATTSPAFHPSAERESAWAAAIQSGLTAAAELATITPDAPRETARPLHRAVAAGRRAEAAMVAAFEGLAQQAARSHSGRGVHHDDLLQEARIGLLQAARKYDPSLGNRFSTAAFQRVNGAVVDCIREHARTIRLPKDIHDELAKVERARTTLTARTGTEPTTDELAAELGFTTARIEQLAAWAAPTGALTDDMAAGLADAEAVAVDAELEAADALAALLSPLAAGSKQRRVLELRLGLVDDELPRSQAAVAKVLGISQAAVHALEKRAIKALAEAA